MSPLQTSSPKNLPGNDEQNFQKKPIEQPILDQSLRGQIAGGEKPKSSGLKGFLRENRWYVTAIAAGLLIIGVLAFFAFRGGPIQPPTEANVDISVSVGDSSLAQESVPVGANAIYKIKIQNNDKEKLVGMQLELIYPEGMVYVSSVPNADNLSGTQFKVPDLVPGQNAVVMVKAKASGNVNDEKKLIARLHYRYSNFNSDFVKDQSFTVKLAAADLLLDVSGPDSVNNAQPVMYQITYKNNSDQDIKNARIQVTFPPGFDFADSQPTPTTGGNIWNLSLVPSGQSGTISIQGTFHSASPGESKTINVDFQSLDDKGQANTQATKSFSTAINALPLLVSQELENTSSDSVVHPGDRLTFNVKYQNNASTAATAVNIIVTLDSKALDLSTIQAEGGVVSNNTILWNAASVPNLAALNPSDSGQLSFSVDVKDPATRDSSTKLTVVSDIKIGSNEYNPALPGNKLTLKISSPITPSSLLEFSSGSLPPKVGTASIYKVKISLKNETNDYSDGALTASIPANGFVPGSVNAAEAGKVNYDQSMGKLTWNFGNLPAHTGVFSQSRTLEFSVRIIPSASQVNQSPILVKDIGISARDLFTGETVNYSLDNITTASLPGQQGWSNGVVQQ